MSVVIDVCILIVTIYEQKSHNAAASSFVFCQAQDVFTGQIISGLKPSANFTVIINPSGVVMWYLYPTMYLGQSEIMTFHPFAL